MSTSDLIIIAGTLVGLSAIAYGTYRGIQSIRDDRYAQRDVFGDAYLSLGDFGDNLGPMISPSIHLG